MHVSMKEIVEEDHLEEGVQAYHPNTGETLKLAASKENTVNSRTPVTLVPHHQQFVADKRLEGVRKGNLTAHPEHL